MRTRVARLQVHAMLSTLRGKRSVSEGNACNGWCGGRFLHNCCLGPSPLPALESILGGGTLLD